MSLPAGESGLPTLGTTDPSTGGTAGAPVDEAARAAFRDALDAALRPAFVLGRELVGGGMSRVFVAEEVTLGRTVVIKVLPPDLAAGVNRERFRREMQLAARLQHPHVVPLFSAGEAAESLYYTMPYIEGDSLRERARALGARGERFGVREVVRVLHDVVEALAYAHGRGVVHRDVKPGNVLMLGSHALVTDFGVAKALSASLAHSGMTSVGLAIGTPAYMAPEQLAADPAADHRMDLYAAGLLAYELLSGASPFAASSPQATLAAQLTRVPQPIHALRPDVPPALSSVIMRCLAKDPADRPATAEALLAELEAAVSGATLPADRPAAATLGAGLALGSGETTPAATMPASSGPTLGGMPTAATVAANFPVRYDARTLPTPAAPRRRTGGTIAAGAAVLALLGAAWALGNADGRHDARRSRAARDSATRGAATAAATAAAPVAAPPVPAAPPAPVAPSVSRLTRDDSLAIAAAVERRLVEERRREEAQRQHALSPAEVQAMRADAWRDVVDSAVRGSSEAWQRYARETVRSSVMRMPNAPAGPNAATGGVVVDIPGVPTMVHVPPARELEEAQRVAEIAKLASLLPPPREGARRVALLTLRDGIGRRDLTGMADALNETIRAALVKRGGYDYTDAALAQAAQKTRLRASSVTGMTAAGAAVYGTVFTSKDTVIALAQVFDARRNRPFVARASRPIDDSDPAAQGAALGAMLVPVVVEMLDRVSWGGPPMQRTMP